MSPSSVLASPVTDSFVVLAVLALFAAVGWWLGGGRCDDGELLDRLAVSLVLGMLFVIGVGVTMLYGRAGMHTVTPLLLLGFSTLARRRISPIALRTPPDERRQLWYSILALLLAVFLFHACRNDWRTADGMVRFDHSDYGFYALLAKGLAATKVSTGWAAAVGQLAVEAGQTDDQWYHWGPVWLGMLIMKVTGIPAVEAVLWCGSAVMVVILALLAGAMVRAVTGWSHGWSILLGVISIMAMPYPESLREVSPFGFVEHSRESLLWNFAYYFEAVLVLTMLLSWVRGRLALAIFMAVCATLSSPHFVGGVGVALGTLMVGGLIIRDRALWQPTAVAVGAILATWGLLRFGFGSAVSANHTADGAAMDATRVLYAARYGSLSAAIEFAVCGLLVPGWLLLLRSKGEPLTERVRVLGWLTIAGVIGGMIASYLFNNVEEIHFTDFPITIIAMPAGIWGLALLAKSPKRWLRYVAVSLIAVCAVNGITTLYFQKVHSYHPPLRLSQVNGLKAVLKGDAFGYYAVADRQWWLPKYAFLAAMVDSRCIRLVPSVKADMENKIARAGRNFLPLEIVPFEPGTSIIDWSLKLADALSVSYVLDTQNDPAPPEIIGASECVFSDGDVRLYRIPPIPPSTQPNKMPGG
jgi:hypothetical protein